MLKYDSDKSEVRNQLGLGGGPGGPGGPPGQGFPPGKAFPLFSSFCSCLTNKVMVKVKAPLMDTQVSKEVRPPRVLLVLTFEGQQGYPPGYSPGHQGGTIIIIPCFIHPSFPHSTGPGPSQGGYPPGHGGPSPGFQGGPPQGGFHSLFLSVLIVQVLVTVVPREVAALFPLCLPFFLISQLGPDQGGYNPRHGGPPPGLSPDHQGGPGEFLFQIHLYPISCSGPSQGGYPPGHSGPSPGHQGGGFILLLPIVSLTLSSIWLPSRSWRPLT